MEQRGLDRSAERSFYSQSTTDELSRCRFFLEPPNSAEKRRSTRQADDFPAMFLFGQIQTRRTARFNELIG